MVRLTVLQNEASDESRIYDIETFGFQKDREVSDGDLQVVGLLLDGGHSFVKEGDIDAAGLLALAANYVEVRRFD